MGFKWAIVVGLNFYLSCVYGDPNQQYRHLLWERIQRIGVSRNGPWLLVGDFNEILNNTEKDGGVVRDESTFQDFRNLYVACDLRDLRSTGDKFSWVGKRKTHVIKSCLDRVVANSEWLSLYPASEAEFLRLSGSDHRPVVTTVSFLNQSHKKPFRFDKRLFKVKDFKKYVDSGWNSLGGGRQILIGKRIADCRKAMSVCRQENKLNAAKRIEDLQYELDFVLTSSGPIRSQIPRIKKELAQAYRDEETYWYLKSRNNWLSCGDRNTKFYHATTKARFSRNKIHAVHDVNGFVYKGDEAIGRHAECFFKEVYRGGNTSLLPSVFKDFKPTVTADINDDILGIFLTKKYMLQFVTLVQTKLQARMG